MTERIGSREFLGLHQLPDIPSYAMAVAYELCSGRGDLWGGVALAAAMHALSDQLEQWPVVFASAQFLSNKAGAERLQLDCEIASQSRTVAQGYVRGQLDDVDFLRVSACLGSRVSKAVKDAPIASPIPHYDDCDDIDLGDPRSAIHTRTQLRLARGMFGVTGQGAPSDDGTLSMWVRLPSVANDLGALAILADYMLSGIGNSLGEVAYGVSLDNTIRAAHATETDWVQCDIKMDHIGSGFGYGTAHLFSEDKVLMATASQSVIVRIPDA